MCRPRSFQLASIATCVLLTLYGCGGNKESNRNGSATAPTTSGTGTTNSGTGTTNSGTGTTNSNTTAFDVAATTTAATAESKMVADIVALNFTLAVTGSDPVEITEITIAAKGTTDESTAIGELKLIGDDNANGAFDQGEQALATLAAPAFPADDASVTVALSNPLQIAGGASLSLLVTVDATPGLQSALARIGETIELEITAAGDVVATRNGQSITPTPTSFPIPGIATTLFVHDHLLISEVVRMPAQPIDLSNIYVTDTTELSTTPNFRYHNLPTGQDFQPSTTADFIARFPANASIAPGQAITIAMDGTTFETFYTQSADYCLRNPSGTAVAMLGDDGQNPPTWAAANINGGLTDSGEPVIIFHWDGQSDLVQDVDYIYYGSSSASNARVEKDPTISIDGPDADTNPSTYLADTPSFTQTQFLAGAFPNSAIARVEFTEAGETATGGNGQIGHDETSEPFDVNFANQAPTPGTP